MKDKEEKAGVKQIKAQPEALEWQDCLTSHSKHTPLTTIVIQFHIQASPALCFDLARSIELHQVSTSQTKERAIDGVTSGLIESGQSVTWHARHFGIWQTLTSKITEFDPPYRFVDEMVEGAYVHFRHEHKFEATEGGTLMTDTFAYSVPYGILGRLFDWLILKRYMKGFLTKRNEVIKAKAESHKWINILDSESKDNYAHRPDNFIIAKKIFEKLWFASDDGLESITSMGFHTMELSKSLGISKSLIYPLLKSLINEGIITEISEKPILYRFTQKGMMIRSDQDIRNFLNDIGLTH